MDFQQRKDKREEILRTFDPDQNGLMAQGIFGLPFAPEEAETVLVPVLWETTVSYGEGTAHGPSAILKSSQQLDLHDPMYPGGWKHGISMLEIKGQWLADALDLRSSTNMYLKEYEGSPGKVSPQGLQILNNANKVGAKLNAWVERETGRWLDDGRIVGIVGGEHSVPLGFFAALAQRHQSFGILQIDAHADLRKAYEGFEFSHASVMYNALQLPQLQTLVQVGIRDISEGEMDYAEKMGGRVRMHTDYELKNRLYRGESWHSIVQEIVSTLPNKVHISFDIDGLQPWLCPGTGTPVPGGLLLEEAALLLEEVVASGRHIVGFDLCEVAPADDDEWNGNVGARVLYKLCMAAAKAKFEEI